MAEGPRELDELPSPLVRPEHADEREVSGLACLQAGAARVLAIDATPMIEVARETFARAGLADRCELIRGQSFRIDVPVQADVAICDHVGFFGFDYGITELLQDAPGIFSTSTNGVRVSEQPELRRSTTGALDCILQTTHTFLVASLEKANPGQQGVAVDEGRIELDRKCELLRGLFESARPLPRLRAS